VRRRAFLAGLGALAAARLQAAEITFPQVREGKPLRFPRDHGAHPDYRTEWWYVTGWLKTSRGEDLGMQITFFRTRTPYATENPSAFAPRQLLLAHAALADPKIGRLRHDEHAARAVLGVAGAAEDTTRVWIDKWSLTLEGTRYRALIPARDFTLDLEFTPERPPLLQGINGFSRKGRSDLEASYYYSRPHLTVSGSIERGAGREEVRGQAWLDHEWSSQYLASGASGWDWIGINLDDGGALMAFRMRGRDGALLYAGAKRTLPDGTSESFAPEDVDFTPLRRWRSPRTGTEYPVAMQVRTGKHLWQIEPLFDDQELDARASTATIYWEGAVRVRGDGSGTSSVAGRGYLELTGYWQPMRI
jgi:predicted secreted hydrolase